jgi:hypothetical protein
LLQIVLIKGLRSHHFTRPSAVLSKARFFTITSRGVFEACCMSKKPKGWYKEIVIRPTLPVDGYEWKLKKLTTKSFCLSNG